MSRSDASLAREITWRESKQSYLTMRLLVDRDLLDDSFRAYAYFRWVDDVVDNVSRSKTGRVAFIQRQRALIEALYAGGRPALLCREENLIADLIRNDRGSNSHLRSYIMNFLAIIEFDAGRNGSRISDEELRIYSDRLALAVTDAIQYFIRNGHPYPEDQHRTSAARAAHVTHMLRDMREDLKVGYVNLPREYLERTGIDPTDVDNPIFRSWVRSRVTEARQAFHLGKIYIDRLDVLRTKLAAYWYCSRFEQVLNIIEKDGYRLRLEYSAGHGVVDWLRMAWIAVRVTLRHELSEASKKRRSRAVRMGEGRGSIARSERKTVVG